MSNSVFLQSNYSTMVNFGMTIKLKIAHQYIQLCLSSHLCSLRKHRTKKSQTRINKDTEIKINSYYKTLNPSWLQHSWGQWEVIWAGSQTSQWVCILSRPWRCPPACSFSLCSTTPWAYSCQSGMAMSPAIFELCCVFAGSPIDPCSDSYGCGHYSALKEPDASDGMKELLSTEGVRMSAL